MTPVKNQKGFTIIEVMLFLALSGLVFIIGFMGVGNRNNEVQFTSSVRGLDSYLQGQLNQVFNGVNNGAFVPDPLASGDNVLLGKYVAFCTSANSHAACGGNSSKVLVYNVVGTKLTNHMISDIVNGDISACGGGHGSADVEIRMLDCAKPSVTGGPPEELTLDWGTINLSANSGGLSNYATPGFGFLKSPNSNRIILIGHTGGPAPSEGAFIDKLSPGDNQMFHSTKNGYNSNSNLFFCVKGRNDRYATIAAGYQERQTAFDVIFDPANIDTDKTCGPL